MGGWRWWKNWTWVSDTHDWWPEDGNFSPSLKEYKTFTQSGFRLGPVSKLYQQSHPAVCVCVCVCVCVRERERERENFVLCYVCLWYCFLCECVWVDFISIGVCVLKSAHHVMSQECYQDLALINVHYCCWRWYHHSHTYQGFPTRMVYLYYISCLRYTILVRNPWIILISLVVHMKRERLREGEGDWHVMGQWCYQDLALFHLHLHLGFVHPLQDVALHQCLSSSSVCCLPNPGGSLLLCYVILPSSAWSSSRPLPSPWLPLCASPCTVQCLLSIIIVTVGIIIHVHILVSLAVYMKRERGRRWLTDCCITSESLVWWAHGKSLSSNRKELKTLVQSGLKLKTVQILPAKPPSLQWERKRERERERERTRTRTLYVIKHLGCMYKGGVINSLTVRDISFGKSLSKLYTGGGGGGGGGGEQQSKGQS